MTWWMAFHRVTDPSGPQCPIGDTGCPYSMWEETTQGSECQEVRIIAELLEDWVSQEAKSLCSNGKEEKQCWDVSKKGVVETVLRRIGHEEQRGLTVYLGGAEPGTVIEAGAETWRPS